MTEALASAQPWHAAFPSPVSTGARISVNELAQVLRQHGPVSKECLVVDVRHTDFDVGFIRGAVNLPAQSLHRTLPALVQLLSGYSRVVFHCQSSNGRGPGAAGWVADAFEAAAVPPDARPSVLVLTGGIKAWMAVHGEDPSLTVKLNG